jgi:hypothetical protein
VPCADDAAWWRPLLLLLLLLLMLPQLSFYSPWHCPVIISPHGDAASAVTVSTAACVTAAAAGITAACTAASIAFLARLTQHWLLLLLLSALQWWRQQ